MSLSLDDARRISLSVTAVISEKQKALKPAPGKGKKGKVALKTYLNDDLDTTVYGNGTISNGPCSFRVALC